VIYITVFADTVWIIGKICLLCELKISDYLIVNTGLQITVRAVTELYIAPLV
jgi:hypothetical protein